MITDFNLIQDPKIFNGLNLNPIPLEFGQSMTTTKELLAIQNAISTLVINVNSLFSEGVEHTNNEIIALNELLTTINTLDAKFLKPQSVTLDKLSNESITTLHDRIMSYIGNIMKFVTFEINTEGYFVANVPETWGGINFSTDVDGCLVLSINY